MNERQKETQKYECVICYEETFEKNVCGHTICDDCFQECLKRWNPFKCPICRIILAENAIDENAVDENAINENAINENATTNLVNVNRNPTVIQHFDSWLVEQIISDTDNSLNMRIYLKPIRGFPFLFNFETCNYGIKVVSVKYPWIAKFLRFRNTWKPGDVIIYVNNESALTTNFGMFRYSRDLSLCHVLDRELFERFLTENV